MASHTRAAVSREPNGQNGTLCARHNIYHICCIIDVFARLVFRISIDITHIIQKGALTAIINYAC